MKRLFKVLTLAGLIGGLAMSRKASGRGVTECHCTETECSCTSKKQEANVVRGLADKARAVRDRLPI